MEKKEKAGKEGREGIVSPSPAPPPSFKILKTPLSITELYCNGVVVTPIHIVNSAPLHVQTFPDAP